MTSIREQASAVICGSLRVAVEVSLQRRVLEPVQHPFARGFHVGDRVLGSAAEGRPQVLELVGDAVDPFPEVGGVESTQIWTPNRSPCGIPKSSKSWPRITLWISRRRGIRSTP